MRDLLRRETILSDDEIDDVLARMQNTKPISKPIPVAPPITITPPMPSSPMPSSPMPTPPMPIQPETFEDLPELDPNEENVSPLVSELSDKLGRVT